MTCRSIRPPLTGACLLFVIVFVSGASVSAQSVATLETGESVYRAACAACHGPDGRGAPQPRSGSTYRCRTSPTAVSTRASPPPTGSRSVMTAVPPRIRCADAGLRTGADGRPDRDGRRAYQAVSATTPSWPAGELNLPRALVTEKAFPEDEAVLSTTIASGTFVNEFLYERRIGARTQYEVKVPVAVQEGDTGWRRGLGDVAAAVKHAFHHSLERGRIFAAAAEIIFPTGKENEGLERRCHRVRAVRRLRADAAGRRLHPGADRVRDPVRRGPRQRVLLARARRQELRAGPVRAHMVADGRGARRKGAGRRRAGALGRRAADAGDPQQTAAHHDQRRRQGAGERARRAPARRSSPISCGTGSTEGSSMAGASSRRTRSLSCSCASCGSGRCCGRRAAAPRARKAIRHRPAGPVSFQTGAECMACHNGLTTPSRRGRLDWRELARLDDGALLAGPVLAGRRPARGDRSSGACRGDRGRVLHLPHADDHLSGPRRRATRQGVRTPSHRRPRRRDPLAADGVSCTVCHQITNERLGTPESFTGGYVLNVASPCRPAADVRTVPGG